MRNSSYVVTYPEGVGLGFVGFRVLYVPNIEKPQIPPADALLVRLAGSQPRRCKAEVGRYSPPLHSSKKQDRAQISKKTRGRGRMAPSSPAKKENNNIVFVAITTQ